MTLEFTYHSLEQFWLAEAESRDPSLFRGGRNQKKMYRESEPQPGARSFEPGLLKRARAGAGNINL